MIGPFDLEPEPEKKYSVSIMRGGEGRRRGRMGLGIDRFLSDLRVEVEVPVMVELKLSGLSFKMASLRRDFLATDALLVDDGTGEGEGDARAERVGVSSGGSTNGVTPPTGTVRTFFHVVSSAFTTRTSDLSARLRPNS